MKVKSIIGSAARLTSTHLAASVVRRTEFQDLNIIPDVSPSCPSQLNMYSVAKGSVHDPALRI